VEASSLAQAFIAVEDDPPPAVILDHALSDGESSQLRDLLKGRNIPYVVHSGYSPRQYNGPSVKITGDLWSEGDVQIDGHLCGNINCAQLIVSKDAAVTGVIIAEEAVIRGKITGIIRATRVLLQDTARVKSEIIYQSLSIDEGATFEGVARPRLNPLEEEIAVSPMAELRQITARIEAGCANGSGPGCMPLAVDKAGPVSPPEPAGKSSDRVQPAAKRRRRKHRQLREYRMSLDDVHEPGSDHVAGRGAGQILAGKASST
jgi:cytoskeletal protein CcmA (bactofilin family)